MKNVAKVLKWGVVTLFSLLTLLIIINIKPIVETFFISEDGDFLTGGLGLFTVILWPNFLLLLYFLGKFKNNSKIAIVLSTICIVLIYFGIGSVYGVFSYNFKVKMLDGILIQVLGEYVIIIQAILLLHLTIQHIILSSNIRSILDILIVFTIILNICYFIFLPILIDNWIVLANISSVITVIVNLIAIIYMILNLFQQEDVKKI